MTESTPDPISSARMKRFVRPAKWGVGLVAAVAVLGFGVVPPVARHYAVQILNDKLGREVSIERIGFNPFTLTAEVHGAKVMEADGGGEALSLDLLRANLELESLLRGGPVLHELAVRGPRLHLVNEGEGRTNWSDVIERLATPPEEDSGETRFSIGNISVDGGRIEIDDKTKGLKHEISELNIGVPFVSNLPVKVDVFVEPKLSAKINGDDLVLTGRSKPFSETRETVLDIVLKDFEVSRWLAYLPFEPGFLIPSGTLTTNLEVGFSQPADGQPAVTLKGQAQLNGLVVQDRKGQPAVSIGELGVEFADVQPLANRWHFSRLLLQQPEIDVVRQADGSLNLMGLLPKADRGAKDGGRKPAAKQAPAQAEAAPAADTPPLSFLLAQARIREGVVRFTDEGFKKPFQARVEAINLDLRDLANTGDMPADIRLDYHTDGGEKFSHQDQLRLAPNVELEGSVLVETLQPARYAAYFADALPGGELRDAKLDAALRYHLKLGGKEPEIKVNAETVALRDFVLALKGSKDAAIKVPAVKVADAEVDVSARTTRLGELGISGASVSAVRLADGSLDLERLVGKSSGGASGPAWTANIGRFSLTGSSLRLEDRTAGKPVVMTADGLSFKAENLSTTKGAVAKIDLDSRINKNGKLGVEGSFGLEPLKADLKLNLSKVDLLPLQPYVLEETKIAISRGNLTTQGRLQLASARGGELEARFQGDLGVADFASVDRLNATDFVRWRILNLSAIDFRLAPFSLGIGDVALNDFYTRLILNEQGQLNLREIRPGAEADAQVQQGPLPAAEPASGPVAAAPGKGTATAEVPPPAEVPPLKVNRIRIRGGNIAFSDRFVRPNYDANLTGMSGELTGLSSDPSTIAKLDLSGKVDNAAPVSVKGELNPFRQDRYLDIVLAMKDFELTGISSYSGKYVGYGIQRGKLSADLNYKIEDRKLTATNRIFVDQLTFGDKVDSPDALNLPVQLAVSLLKNGRGEIDLNLPVSGTLDDPQFSVFGLVMRALVNLVGKAVTAPFSLLGSMFGGEELSYVEFAPGARKPGGEEAEKLANLAKALKDRPALRLDVTGKADTAADLDGLKRTLMERQVKAEKLKAMVKRGQEAPSLDDIQLDAKEYPALLKEVYDQGKFEKPRNFIGLAKTLPVAEMEALIMANTKVSEENFRSLAQARAQNVKEWLLGEGGVAPERVFLLAPKVEAADGGKGRQVQFSLR
ncbi:DUF748 domain-containing protein [Azoarcus indigens]|uniref:Uncharacterized protein DUF748 n=1 Tax=Azoarcus indigens TaxID=29545 RepID=A0A4V3BLN5_9RHOO|nr:DUF748 domain-containing protein [Azoarcus indigens]NMG67085.1 DUF748 domain-containing protein [Azoarcus indigens]TDN47252.1 uncharacterized protein DUF748 [Azoarcus indigens]